MEFELKQTNENVKEVLEEKTTKKQGITNINISEPQISDVML